MPGHVHKTVTCSLGLLGLYVGDVGDLTCEKAGHI